MSLVDTVMTRRRFLRSNFSINSVLFCCYWLKTKPTSLSLVDTGTARTHFLYSNSSIKVALFCCHWLIAKPTSLSLVDSVIARTRFLCSKSSIKAALFCFHWLITKPYLAVIGGHSDGAHSLPPLKLLHHGDLVAGDFRLLQLHVVAGYLQR
jgi:hypothetical protein